MDPILLVGRYPYSPWVLGARPGGIGSYRPLPQLGVLLCDRGNLGGSPWLLRFVTLPPNQPPPFTGSGVEVDGKWYPVPSSSSPSPPGSPVDPDELDLSYARSPPPDDPWLKRA